MEIIPDLSILYTGNKEDTTCTMCQQGSAEAVSFEEQFRLHYNFLCTIAYYMLEDEDAAGVQIKSDSTAITYTKDNSSNAAPVQDTLTVLVGRQYGLQLSDGTNVSLNAATTQVYAESFSGSTCDVYVTGEAFFEAASDPQHPFVVHMGAVSMKVLGTVFNVNTYETKVVSTLTGGKLLVSDPNDQVVLQPGELFFDDAAMSDIAKVLSGNYEYNFIFDDPAAEKMRCTLGLLKPAVLLDFRASCCAPCHAYISTLRIITSIREKAYSSSAYQWMMRKRNGMKH